MRAHKESSSPPGSQTRPHPLDRRLLRRRPAVTRRFRRFGGVVAAGVAGEVLVADVGQRPVPRPKAFGQGHLSMGGLWCEADHLNDLLADVYRCCTSDWR